MFDQSLLYYLATPYTSYKEGFPKYFEEDKRFSQATEMGAKLTERYQIAIICPITTSATLKEYNHSLGTCWDYWGKIDTIFVNKSDVLLVGMLEGCEKSTGVQAEIKIAQKKGIPIYYIDPNTLEIVMTENVAGGVNV